MSMIKQRGDDEAGAGDNELQKLRFGPGIRLPKAVGAESDSAAPGSSIVFARRFRANRDELYRVRAN